MSLIRPPHASLCPFVETLWASEVPTSFPTSGADRERNLPTGLMHLAVRLAAEPVRLFDDADDHAGHALGFAVVCGARDTAYIRDRTEFARTVGVQLRPGAAEALFGATAAELAGRHTPLEDLWGRSAARLHAQLLEARSLEGRLNILESLLIERLTCARALHPAVAQALNAFATGADIGKVAKSSGYSHRRFLTLFQREVGLTPKRYCRVRRFQRATRRLAAAPTMSLASLAVEAGYSDQPHFTREFRQIAGITPTEYRAAGPISTNHVPIAARRGR